LKATLPELTFKDRPWGGRSSSVLGCRLSIYELTASCSLLTADAPLSSYPTLALSTQRVSHRVDDALTELARESATSEAA
jgi:hypothetical protein